MATASRVISSVQDRADRSHPPRSGRFTAWTPHSSAERQQDEWYAPERPQRVPAMISPTPAEMTPTVREAAPIHNKAMSRFGFCGSRPTTERKKPAGIKIAAYNTALLSCSATAGTPSELVKILITRPRITSTPAWACPARKNAFCRSLVGGFPSVYAKHECAAVGDSDHSEEDPTSRDHGARGKDHVSSPFGCVIGWVVCRQTVAARRATRQTTDRRQPVEEDPRRPTRHSASTWQARAPRTRRRWLRPRCAREIRHCEPGHQRRAGRLCVLGHAVGHDPSRLPVPAGT